MYLSEPQLQVVIDALQVGRYYAAYGDGWVFTPKDVTEVLDKALNLLNVTKEQIDKFDPTE